MGNLLHALRGGKREKRYSMSDYLADLSFMGNQYPIIAGAGTSSEGETIENSFKGYVSSAYKRNGIVFAAITARMLLFSEARFQWQQMEKGRPGDLFGDRSLSLLEVPWPNGTTGELLSRMIQDVDLAGNFYGVHEASSGRIRRLRPDWVTIVLSADPDNAEHSDVVGYAYTPGGINSGNTPTYYPVSEVVHWCPIPDPDAHYRGMSWLTPVLREIQADGSTTEHKLKFFENGATLQTVLTLGETVKEDQFKSWVRKFREAHQGVRNAYEPLFLGGGADAKVVGTDLKSLDFKSVQGGGETRIAAASGMSPVILSLSEGMAGSSLNAGNFQASRRLAADKTLRPLWRSACAALASIMKVPANARLWYDDRDISFLREDMKDLAEIQSTEGQSIRALVEAGFDPESVVKAVQAQDWKLLKHTGAFSVQLQAPGSGDDAKTKEPAATEATSKATTAQKQRDVAETLQKLYLAVGVAITADEARALANKAGADLVIPGPFQPDDEPEPEPVTVPDVVVPEPDDGAGNDGDPQGGPDDVEEQDT